MRDSFIFYRSFYEALDNLPEEEQIKVYKALTKYALSGEEIELSGVAKSIFILIKPQLDANNKKYENGKKGGRPKKETSGLDDDKPNDNLNETKPEPNENDNENGECRMKNENGEGKRKRDPLVCPEIDKIFLIYQENCKDLLPIGRERSSKDIRLLALEFLEEIVDDFEYFRQLCEKANELKTIANSKIDLKMLIRNHIGIDNGKYKEEEKVGSGIDWSKVDPSLLED